MREDPRDDQPSPEPPPVTAAAILARYANGERCFTNLEVEYAADFAESRLDGIVFDGSFLHSASFRLCHLADASFRGCNLKCADFQSANLRGAVFQALLECADFEGANLTDARFAGSSCHSWTVQEGETFPP